MSQHHAGIYVHVPFCAAKCAYCDFYSLPSAQLSANAHERYLSALQNEMRFMRESVIKNTPINTVYIGGGTPTAMPALFLREIMTEISRFFLTADAEITVEANPGTLTPDIFAALSAGGANRLSMGLQAWQDSLLRVLGRIHTATEFKAHFQAARAAGFNNINVDLMFALPGQSLEAWYESLQKTAALSPEHISLYSLTLEEGTPLWRRAQSGEVTLPTEEADRDMYETGRVFLTKQGYQHYELSNFSKPGYESRHNTRYWRREIYYGFGPGAHSFDGTRRWGNTDDFTRYITEKHPPALRDEVQSLSVREAMSETMFLGLRLLEGVSAEAFQAQYGQPPLEIYESAINALTGQGLLRYVHGKYQLTRKGLDLANQVFAAFI